jgi:hypothetical protein
MFYFRYPKKDTKQLYLGRVLGQTIKTALVCITRSTFRECLRVFTLL